MRIITGLARGASLETVSGLHTRPTASRVKHGLFNIIQFDIQSKNVLDLFSGSGQLGLEALSRGAKQCVFVDNSKQAVDIIRKNIKTIEKQSPQLISKTRVVKMDVLSFIGGTPDKFDIVFLDPPYDFDLFDKTLDIVSKYAVNPNGIIVCEHDQHVELPKQIGNFESKTYKYGRTLLDIYR